MAIRFYNTMTKKLEKFKPLKRGIVTMYNCGPTVYDYGHIGNFRSFLFADLLRRYLEYKGYKVKQVMNFTDVGHMTIDEVADGKGEDKIELSAKRLHKTPYEIAEYYIKAFLEDSKTLNLKEPFKRPRATKHISDMINLIKKLIDKGYAYEKNGNVFFEIAKFKNYGKLSGNTLDKLKVGKRLEAHPDKKDPRDFALWLHDPKHIMQWESPWGRGYPGCHIECSAMSMKYLGETIDIHTGGEDNIFPHHECEIAQSEAATGKTFVRYWMHVRHLLVNGEKMSKSKGNFYTLRDLLKKGYNPMAIRYLLISAHYRTRLNFTENGLKQAEKTLEKINEFIEKVKHGKDNKNSIRAINTVKKAFETAMDNDMNISGALAAIFDFMKKINKVGGGKRVFDTMMKFDTVLGLNLGKGILISKHVNINGKKINITANFNITKDIEKKIIEREKYRMKKKWSISDKIRKELQQKGILIEDVENGVKLKKRQS